MRVLVGKTFGIGNTVLSIPMIKAIDLIAETHVLVGTGPDDYGAREVIEQLRVLFPSITLHLNSVPLDIVFDAAVMAIPFDGRWKNGVHFAAMKVMDCRKRPNDVERLGFDMWEQHEILYQMENAYGLGYDGTIPSSKFFDIDEKVTDPDLVYLGIGFKRDPGGFGLSKHYGNERYAELIREIMKYRPGARFISTGGPTDLIQVGYQINRLLQSTDIYRCLPLGLPASFEVLGVCGSYLGNDTGMMHVAASLDLPCYSLMLSEHLIRKNHPWTPSWNCSFLDRNPRDVAKDFVMLVWGES